jgi:hypothetical protein
MTVKPSPSTITRRQFGLLIGAAGIAAAAPVSAADLTFSEAPDLADLVKKGSLPPVADRLPKQPLVADFGSRKREIGRYGGEMRTLVAKARDLRYLSANGYTRLVGYDEKLELQPDLASRSRSRTTGSSRSPFAKVTAGRTGTRSPSRISATGGRTWRSTRS